MKKNVGTIDKIIRLVIVVSISVLYFTNQISGLATIILGSLSVIFLLTSLLSFCPLYLPFGISTRKK
jgi:hypothetical protein